MTKPADPDDAKTLAAQLELSAECEDIDAALAIQRAVLVALRMLVDKNESLFQSWRTEAGAGDSGD